MLQNEFEERIGRSVSEEEFTDANAMYLAAGDAMDKDVFCREWMTIGESPLVRGLFDTAYNLNQALQEHKLMHKECQEIISDAADAMLDIEKEILDGETVEHTIWDLDKKVWWLVGQKQAVLRKLKKGISLSEEDVKFISNNLK